MSDRCAPRRPAAVRLTPAGTPTPTHSYLLIVYNQVSGPFSCYLPWTTCYGPERDTITKMGSLAGLPLGMLVFGALADKVSTRSAAPGRGWGLTQF